MILAVLSTENNPILPFFLKKLIKTNIKFVLILDKKKTPLKDLNIFRERTEKNFIDYDLYDLKKNFDVLFISSHNQKYLKKIINDKKILMGINIGVTRKISKKTINYFKKGILNIHPGILPNYRGCTCVEWAIFNNDRVGNTIHLMNEDYDKGPIIDIQKYYFKKNDTYKKIRTKVYKKGILFAIKKLITLFKNPKNIKLQKQNNNLGKYYKVIPKSKMKLVLNKINKKHYKYLE